MAGSVWSRLWSGLCRKWVQEYLVSGLGKHGEMPCKEYYIELQSMRITNKFIDSVGLTPECFLVVIEFLLLLSVALPFKEDLLSNILSFPMESALRFNHPNHRKEVPSGGSRFCQGEDGGLNLLNFVC
ncbi:MAG: hypothetical protein Ta2E_08780 [Mycoplasmoidaceae bacterium]|nr:MAG: hypothetical protein Ta2E_08780 [Mycoplasmoidaceae bacterium]